MTKSSNSSKNNNNLGLNNISWVYINELPFKDGCIKNIRIISPKKKAEVVCILSS